MRVLAQRKPYNPNTAYGRRKLREQSQQTYENLPEDEKHNWDMAKFIILLIIVILAFVLLGQKDALKWLSH